MVVLVAKKNSVEKKGSFLLGLMCWRLLVILRGGQHLLVLTGLLFLQVVVGIDASGCHTRIACIDVHVVIVVVTEAVHSVDISESVFLWKNGELICDMGVENSSSGPVVMILQPWQRNS